MKAGQEVPEVVVTAEVVDVEVIVTEAVTAGVTDPGLAPEVVGRDPAAVAAGTDLIHHLPADAGALPDPRAALKPRTTRSNEKFFL